MNPHEEQTLWIGAFRYYLGRRSYAVTDFCELLIREWEELPESTRGLIHRELDETFQMDDETPLEFPRLGDACDRAAWQKVKNLWSN